MINILEDSQKVGRGGIYIATDSAKAYDCVDERDICKVLEKFGFPKAFINTTRQLFFQNDITVNMKSFLSEPVQQ